MDEEENKRRNLNDVRAWTALMTLITAGYSWFMLTQGYSALFDSLQEIGLDRLASSITSIYASLLIFIVLSTSTLRGIPITEMLFVPPGDKLRSLAAILISMFIWYVIFGGFGFGWPDGVDGDPLRATADQRRVN